MYCNFEDLGLLAIGGVCTLCVLFGIVLMFIDAYKK